MTVIDLRDRLVIGRRAGEQAPRKAAVTVASTEARDLYRRPEPRVHVGRLALGDLVIALLVVGVAALVVGSSTAAAWQWVALVIAWSLALRASGAYVRALRIAPRRSQASIGRAAMYVCALMGLLSALPSVTLTGDLAVTTVVLAGVTALSRKLVDARLSDQVDEIPTAIVRGDGRDVTEFLKSLSAERSPAFDVTAVQITDGALVLPEEFADVYVMPGDLDLVDHAILSGAANVVLVGAQPEDSEDVRRMLWRLEGHGTGTYLVPVVADLAVPQVESLTHSGVPMLAFNSRDLGAEVGVTKVVLDKVLALAGLVVLLPLLAAIVVAIKLESRGPVLFRQVRVGLGGRQFEMLKFRTMVQDAEALRAALEEQNRHSGGTLFKMADDPRITRVGKYLRKFSLDELPQLFNVVRGEMSLVGPRPPLPSEVANYPLDAHRRFCVRPGLTGLWQVSGRSDLDPESSWRLDTHYVEAWSPGLDVSILARTPKAVLSADGAY